MAKGIAADWLFIRLFRSQIGAQAFENRADMELWFAVLSRAIYDIHDSKRPYIRRNALIWFATGAHAFVCDMLNLNHEWVLSVIRKHAAANVVRLLERAKHDTRYRRAGCNIAPMDGKTRNTSDTPRFKQARSAKRRAHSQC